MKAQAQVQAQAHVQVQAQVQAQAQAQAKAGGYRSCQASRWGGWPSQASTMPATRSLCAATNAMMAGAH